MAVKTKEQIKNEADTLIPDNDKQLVSPADIRNRIIDLADSAAFTATLPALANVAITGSYLDLANTPDFANVALSGDYSDLSGRPALANVATTGQYVDLINKPSFATVATSGAYNDLTGKPTLGTAASANANTFATAAQGTKADSAVQSVNGKTGNSVTLVKSDVGLGNVDNTSDLNKPISTATQNALNLKANDSIVVKTVNGVAPISGNVTISLEEKRLQDTRTTAIAESFPSNVQFVETAGYSSVGDGGGALYKRVPTPTILGNDIIINGGFSSDTSWIKGTGWTIASGKASKAITGSQSELGQTTTLVAGDIYAVTYTIADYSGSGWIRPYFGYNGATVIGSQRTSNGTYTDYITAAPLNGRVVFQAQATVACSIDNVSVRKVLAAFQSADGAWWEMTNDPNGASVVAFGADPIGTLNSTEAFNSCASFCATIGVPLLCPLGTYKLEANVASVGNIEWFVSEKAQFTGVGLLPSYGGTNTGYRRPNETKHSVVVGTKTNPVTDVKSAFSATLYSAAPPGSGPKASIVGYSELHSSVNDAAVVGGFFEADDLVGWANSGSTGSNSFVEGARAHGVVRSSAPNGSAYGMVAAAMSGTAAPKYLVSFEGGIHKFGGVDAPSPQFMDKELLSVGFLASCHGTYRSDAAFMVNPWNDQKFAVGLHIPKGTVANRAIYIDSDVNTAIDVAGTTSFASVMVPNDSPIRGRNANNSLQYYLIGVTPENNIRIGQADANAITIAIPGLGERTIEYGPPDSGGTGYRILRIAN